MRPASRLAFVSVLAAALLLAGCLGSGGGSRGKTAGHTGTSASSGCGAAQQAERSGSSPGLYREASANQVDGEQRTVRWDLVAGSVCAKLPATVSVQASTHPPLQDCPPVEYRASVTTGVTEKEVALAGSGALEGQATIQPQNASLGNGPASFVLSLAATMASNGFEPHDQECLEAALQSFALHASYSAP